MQICDIPVGAALALGRIWDTSSRNQRELVWIKASKENDFYANTSIDHVCVDAPEPNSAIKACQERGSNIFPETNICQFLNASNDSWYKPSHEADVLADCFKGIPGFLSRFHDYELDIIEPHQVVVSIPEGRRRQYGRQLSATLKVSLMSRSQVFGDGDLAEGEQFPVFHDLLRSIPTTVLRTASAKNLLFTLGTRSGSLRPDAKFKIVPLLRLKGNCHVKSETGVGHYLISRPDRENQEIIEELRALWH